MSTIVVNEGGADRAGVFLLSERPAASPNNVGARIWVTDLTDGPGSQESDGTQWLDVANSGQAIQQNRGAISATTDGSGDVLISHGLASTPVAVIAARSGTVFGVAQCHTIGATTFKVRFFDAAGAAITATAVTGSWMALL